MKGLQFGDEIPAVVKEELCIGFGEGGVVGIPLGKGLLDAAAHVVVNEFEFFAGDIKNSIILHYTYFLNDPRLDLFQWGSFPL